MLPRVVVCAFSPAEQSTHSPFLLVLVGILADPLVFREARMRRASPSFCFLLRHCVVGLITCYSRFGLHRSPDLSNNLEAARLQILVPKSSSSSLPSLFE